MDTTEKANTRIYHQTFIFCECKTHMIGVEVDSEFMPGHVEVAFWKLGHDGDTEWKTKIRHIYQILRHGHPYHCRPRS